MDITDTAVVSLLARTQEGTAQSFELRPLVIPASVDAADAADFVTMAHLRNDIYAEISGNRDEALSPVELLPFFRPSPDLDRLSWLIVVDGDIVGRAIVDLPAESGSTVSFALIEMRRALAGRGIGSAVLPVLEQAARDAGRTVMQSWIEHPAQPGPSLAAPTGFGTIPRDHAARFALRHGFTLEQVERKSALDLTSGLDRIEALLADARRAATGYRVEQWLLPTPAEFRSGYAWAKSRMSTDAPAADLEFDEEVWDEDRLMRSDARYLEGGQTVLVTVAVEEATGTVVAFNELAIGHDLSGATSQEDTLVLREHRGHHLGMLVKCAGILRWKEIAPLSPKVITYNAEENRPMLDINETIGFVPVTYSGAWKKRLG